MFSKKPFRRVFYTVISIMIIWTILTIWAQYSGQSKTTVIGDTNASYTALIVYNPDPIYNLDEQVCESFAKGLNQYDFSSTIITTAYEKEINSDYDLYVFCANTYNWAPDWETTEMVGKICHEKSQVVAITLGSGSTQRAQRLLEEAIANTNAQLIGSKAFWLMKPNNENRIEENNVDVANDMAKSFGESIGKEMLSGLSN